MIHPTIGRRVWYWPNGATYLDGKQLTVINPSVPLDAGVVFVWGERCVNLDIADHLGEHYSAQSVKLLQDDDPVPPHGSYATWMPYQTGQAKREAGQPIDPTNVAKPGDPQPA